MRRGFAVSILLVLSCHAQGIKNRNLKTGASDTPSTTVTGHVPRGYAVIVGVTRYQAAAVSPLQFPEIDAEAMYRVLISQQGGAFPPENVHKLLGANATLANMRHEIEDWLPSVAQPEDRVIVYFAGHGVISRGRGYLAPWDIEVGRVEDTAYPMQTLGNVLANRVKARWKALFTDACHSGQINAETTDESVTAQLDSAASQYLSFTATLGKQKSYEDPDLAAGGQGRAGGIFTFFLVEGLKGNADNDPCDSLVTADELVEYVRTEVRKYAAAHGVPQTPHANSDYEPAMPLGVSMRCGAAGADASVSGSLVIESEAEDVEIFVDDDLVGKLGKGAPITVPGLAEGAHVVKAAKTGYKPEVQQVVIIRGRPTTVTIHMRFPVKVKREAEALEQQGFKLLHNQHSSVKPLAQLTAVHSQSERDLRQAKNLFVRALQADPDYSVAAYDLGNVNKALGDNEGSKAAFLRAIELDPAFVPARMEYADIMLSGGDADEAVRQLVEAARFEPANARIHALLAAAYWEKSSWKQCVTEADQALRINLGSFEGNFWRADCLRQIAADPQPAPNKPILFAQARDSYQAFVSLTNFTTSTVRWIGFHFFVGSRSHADRKETYNAWRDAAYLGLCICEKNLGNLLRAREQCGRAINYDPNDAIAYFFLGNVNRDLFNATKSCDSAKAARSSYQKVVTLNPNLVEAKNATNYLRQFDELRGALRRRGCSDF